MEEYQATPIKEVKTENELKRTMGFFTALSTVMSCFIPSLLIFLSVFPTYPLSLHLNRILVKSPIPLAHKKHLVSLAKILLSIDGICQMRSMPL